MRIVLVFLVARQECLFCEYTGRHFEAHRDNQDPQKYEVEPAPIEGRDRLPWKYAKTRF